ncbi:MAG: aminotransferase class V-fold PLP-dependent enzyme [Spirochaetota bacterium]
MNLEQIRRDTIGCADKLFFNSAGSSLMPKVVLEKMTSYLYEEERLGGYKVSELQAGEIAGFYKETAQLLHTQPENIAFIYHATDAYAKALSAIPFSSGDVILTSDDDYISNHLAFLSLQDRLGIQILRAKNLSNGDIDLSHFETLVQRHKPRLVAITHIPTNSGLVQPVVEIGEICKRYGTWYLLDACQSVGQMVVDVQQIGCDFLSATGRKFLRGPRGTGFLYVSDRVLQEKLCPLFVDMRGADWITADTFQVQMDATRFETWENSYASLIGLKEAVRYANQIGMQTIESYNQQLLFQLRENLLKINSIRVLDRGSQLANLLTFNVPDQELAVVEEALVENTVFYSVSELSSARIDFAKKKVDWAIRLSPHYFNTLEEVEQVSEIVGGLQR